MVPVFCMPCAVRRSFVGVCMYPIQTRYRMSWSSGVWSWRCPSSSKPLKTTPTSQWLHSRWDFVIDCNKLGNCLLVLTDTIASSFTHGRRYDSGSTWHMQCSKVLTRHGRSRRSNNVTTLALRAHKLSLSFTAGLRDASTSGQGITRGQAVAGGKPE